MPSAKGNRGATGRLHAANTAEDHRAFDFPLNCIHNACVMLKSDRDLIHWVKASEANRPSVTLGQLVLLLEMLNSESVASISNGNEADAVNTRQKLSRLESALGIGPLTAALGKRTRLSEAGERLAAEVRMLALEMRAVADAGLESPVWILGAGEAWLHSVIGAALTDVAALHPNWKWQLRNLRSREIVQRVQSGELHFGFVREGDLQGAEGLQLCRRYPTAGYAVIARGVPAAISSAKETIMWLIEQKRPLVQQGSTWPPLREAVSKALRIESLLAVLEPAVACETHPQAAAAAQRGRGWCIVPASVAHYGKASLTGSRRIPVSGPEDEMVLFTCRRRIDKLPDSAAVLGALRVAIGKQIRGAD